MPPVADDARNRDVSNQIYLFQNYPNPFTLTTYISFTIPEPLRPHHRFQHVTLKIYDSDGKEISTLLNDNRLPGYYDVEFYGGNLPSGTYYYELIVGSFHLHAKKMLLVK